MARNVMKHTIHKWGSNIDPLVGPNAQVFPKIKYDGTPYDMFNLSSVWGQAVNVSLSLISTGF